ncbi:ParA family protein [Peterkaempfera griseoplana]|uniref:ParA family protein n=1 Tax=Peterkaempfera griseoplana TaxID=66896 RepID=UPI00099EB37F|nr:ParA family protein [Peterkaempfera griseoplana]
MNESTFAPGGGQPGLAEHAAGLPGEDSGTRLQPVGSVAVRTFEARLAADRDSDLPEHGLSYAEFPYGSYDDPDAEYEPDPEYAATLAPDAARQRRERVGPTGRPLPYFPIPAPLGEHGPAQIIAMCNQKGGVGKTTSTINLGAALAEYGRRVLLVDFDPQGALSVGLGVNPMELDVTVYNLLMTRGMSADEVLLKTAVPGMDLLPSNIDLSAAEVQLVSEVARESALARALKPLLPDYDYIIIDCQPSLGLLTVNALTAAHSVIVPLECEFFALRGVALLTETIEKVCERLNPELRLDGILATMYDSRTVHSREVLARVVEAFGDHVFHTVIGRTVRFPETTVAGEPITTYATNSVGAAAYRQLAREVLARCPAA